MPKVSQNDNNPKISENSNTDDKYEKLANFAQKEIEWVRDAYKWAASIIGIIMIFGIYFTFDNLSDLRSEIRDIEDKVEQKIDNEFNDKSIKKLIESVAKQRMKIVADTFIEEDINEKIQPHINKLKDSITISQQDINNIEDKIKTINPKLSLLTQKLITFSMIIGNKPELWSGGMTTEYRRELENLTRFLGKELKFNSDSLLKDIKKREIELNSKNE